MMGWFSDFPVAVQAALIGALASIVTGIVRDFIATWGAFGDGVAQCDLH
jgi:hypothetical protein